MLRVSKCFLQLHFFCVILVVCGVCASSLSYCIQDVEYYDEERKQCLPCRTCTHPYFVIATCNIYSDAVCGHLSISGGSYLEVLQEKTIDDRVEEPTASVNKSSKSKRKPSEGESYKLKRRKKKMKSHKHFKRKHKKLKEMGTKNRSSTEDHQFNLGIKRESDKSEHTNGSGSNSKHNLNVTTKDGNLFIVTDSKDPKNFLYSYGGKMVVSAVMISINLILILILLLKIIQLHHRKPSKASGCNFPYNQKLPHPSQKPIKCRFTAVLPSKSSECTNLDLSGNSDSSNGSSYLKGSESTNTSSSRVSAPLTRRSQDNGQQPPPPLTAGAEPSERKPLLTPTPEVVERANTIQLYSRIPSPNPFTMDKLLEHKKAVGSSSVENNLYVETWCSSPSPLLSRSQGPSVVPSPTLSAVRRPLSSSTSSSPLTTRTFRATPAFTSFTHIGCKQ